VQIYFSLTHTHTHTHIHTMTKSLSCMWRWRNKRGIWREQKGEEERRTEQKGLITLVFDPEWPGWDYPRGGAGARALSGNTASLGGDLGILTPENEFSDS